MVFRKVREITYCFSEILFLLFFAPFFLFLFDVKSYVCEAKNFPLQFRSDRSQAKLRGFVCNSSNLITSSGAWSKAHWMSFPLIFTKAFGQGVQESCYFCRREACWIAHVATCSEWDRCAWARQLPFEEKDGVSTAEGDAFSSLDRPEVSAHPWHSQKLAALQVKSNQLQYHKNESVCVAMTRAAQDFAQWGPREKGVTFPL